MGLLVWDQWLQRLAGSRSGNLVGQTRRRQTVRPVEVLEDRVVLAAPTISDISNVTLLAGSPLIIPLNGADADNQALRFTASSSNSVVATEISEGSRSIRMDVTNFGRMTFQLFEDRAPRVTNHIIELADSDFYDGSIFHRVINNFVIQGGDPFGNPPGTGGSSLGDFDDQFDIDLQHNRTGLLSMAKTIDDTNDSQFFITEGPQRHLDFNHSIFGILTTGESVRQAISDVPVTSSRPVTDVVVSNFEVFVDPVNGALFLKAAEGATGTSTITVTVTDPDGNTAQDTFTVTIAADTVNNAPFLADIPKLRTLLNTAFSFGLQSIDAEGQAAFFLSQSTLAANSLSVPVTANANLPYTVDFNTGAVQLTPSNGLSGTQRFTVATAVSTQAVDYQVPVLTIVSAAGPLTVTGADHPSGDPGNNGTPDTYTVRRQGNNIEVLINGQSSYLAHRSSLTTLTVTGSADDDTFEIDYSGGDPFPSGGIVFVGGDGLDGIDVFGNSTALTTVTHQLVSDESGSISADANTLTYSAIEILIDSLATTNRVFQFDGTANAITLSDDAVAGNGGSQVISANSVALAFTAPSGSLVVNGGEGNDTITSSALDSLFTIKPTLNGENGNDVLVSNASSDSLDGGAGNDVLTGGAGNDTLVGGAGTDTFKEVAYADNVANQTRTITITNSSMVVAQAAVTISTDVLSGFELLDLSGGAMRDSINASAFTSTGVTTLSGGGNNDTIVGTEGPDSIFTLTGADSLSGLGGSDSIFSGSGNDTLSGGAGFDNLNGQNGNDLINGDADNDVLVGGAGIDTLLGGLGNDFIVSQADAGSLMGGDGDDTLLGFTANDTLAGDGGNDKIYGSTGNDLISGGDGADSLFGDAGADTLNGDAGNDQLTGSVGDDVFNGGAGTDRINETIDANVTITGANMASSVLGNDSSTLVERINLLGGASGNLFDGRLATVVLIMSGDAGADTLLGGSAGDVLNGGNGDDVLSGGGGVDTIDGGDGIDFVFEKANVDFTVVGTQIASSATGTETPTNIERIALIGGTGNNVLNASAATIAVVLIGGAGNDTLLGGSGADVLSGGNRGDSTVAGSDGIDSLNGGGGADANETDASDTVVFDALDTNQANVFALLPSWLDLI